MAINKKEQLKELLEYIPSGAQTLSKNPSQFVIGVTPLSIARAKGVYLWGSDGKKYLDLMLALGPMVFGYAHPRINKAIKAQIDKGMIYSLPSVHELTLAKLLREVVPCADMSRFVMTGSDATTGAIRLARHITRRDHVAKCGYHGWQDWSICTKDGRNTGIPEVLKAMTHDFIYNDIASLEKIFTDYPGKIAAVILEPTASEKPTNDFLKHVQRVAKKNGALLVFDEMITGFRLALGGAQEFFGVTPDLACFGKAVSNGAALGVICGKKEFMGRMDEVFVSGTYAGFAPSLVAAIATVSLMRKTKGMHARMHELGNMLIDGGNAHAKHYGVPVEFVGYGPHPAMKINVKDDYANRVIKTFIYQEMNKAGILFSTSMMIGYVHTPAEIRRVVTRLGDIFKRIAAVRDPLQLVPMLRGDVVVPRTVRNV